jgi:hypothetical protein
MTQRDLNRNVARMTGETVSEIAHRGFSIEGPTMPEPIPESLRETRYIDWDQLKLEQNTAVVEQPMSSLVGHI